MFDFFKGWRRKTGVVTLGLAVGMMGFWIRSFFFEDYLQFCPNQTMYCATSGYGFFALQEIRFAKYEKAPVIEWSSTAITEPLGESGPWNDAEIESHWKCGGAIAGFAYFDGVNPFDKTYLLVPCGVPVVPLTLLSAFLLLWPSRRKPPSPNRGICTDQTNRR